MDAAETREHDDEALRSLLVGLGHSGEVEWKLGGVTYVCAGTCARYPQEEAVVTLDLEDDASKEFVARVTEATLGRVRTVIGFGEVFFERDERDYWPSLSALYAFLRQTFARFECKPTVWFDAEYQPFATVFFRNQCIYPVSGTREQAENLKACVDRRYPALSPIIFQKDGNAWGVCLMFDWRVDW